jgi:hypothetical protein
MHVQIRYVPVSAGPAELQRDTADGLKALIEVALEISNLKEFLGREKPTVITVRAGMFCISRFQLTVVIPVMR